jgi:hypothetical protein
VCIVSYDERRGRVAEIYFKVRSCELPTGCWKHHRSLEMTVVIHRFISQVPVQALFTIKMVDHVKRTGTNIVMHNKQL